MMSGMSLLYFTLAFAIGCATGALGMLKLSRKLILQNKANMMKKDFEEKQQEEKNENNIVYFPCVNNALKEQNKRGTKQ